MGHQPLSEWPVARCFDGVFHKINPHPYDHISLYDPHPPVANKR